MIVERCEAGDRDSLRHALDLFVDAVAVFVRLLVSRAACLPAACRPVLRHAACRSLRGAAASHDAPAAALLLLLPC